MAKQTENTPRRTIPAPVPDPDSIPKKIGRPSTYDSEKHPHQAYVLAARLGADMETIAEIIGVHRDTLYKWRHAYTEFDDAIKNGREHFDSIEVEGSLLKSALGFSFEEKTFERVPVIDPDSKQVVGAQLACTKKIQKFIPPNITAIMFWLQNRMGDRWKNVRKVEATVKNEGRVDHRHAHLHQDQRLMVDYTKLSRADVEQLRKIIEKSVGGNVPQAAPLLESGKASDG